VLALRLRQITEPRKPGLQSVLLLQLRHHLLQVLPAVGAVIGARLVRAAPTEPGGGGELVVGETAVGGVDPPQDRMASVEAVRRLGFSALAEGTVIHIDLRGCLHPQLGERRIAL
jgi:hypothetical protein